MENPLRTARLAVTPKLSHRRAAAALDIALSTLYNQELPSFDPAELSVRELEARARLYGCTVERLLGRSIVTAS